MCCGVRISLMVSVRTACGKFALRALAQSLAREYQPQGIHAAHIIVDGRIGRCVIEFSLAEIKC